MSDTPRFDELLAHAERCLKDKRVYARYADGTPLSNDIPVWMATFAQSYLRDAQSDLAAAVARAERAEAALITARNAMGDALSGWRYIRGTHGDLYGVGWDRVEQKLDAALAAKETKDA
jgi:hypothetical protein